MPAAAKPNSDTLAKCNGGAEDYVDDIGATTGVASEKGQQLTQQHDNIQWEDRIIYTAGEDDGEFDTRMGLSYVDTIKKLGLLIHPTDSDKFNFPTTRPTWLGFEACTILMQLRLKEKSRRTLIKELEDFDAALGRGETITCKQVASLQGSLQYTTLVIEHGASFLQSFIQGVVETGAQIRWAFHRGYDPVIRNAAINRTDIGWWLQILRAGPYAKIHYIEGVGSFLWNKSILESPDII